MNLNEVAKIVSFRTGMDRDVLTSLLPEIVDVIVTALQAGHEVKIRRLGTFTWKLNKPTRRRHPTTKELVNIPGGYTIKFLPSQTLSQRRIPMSDEGMTKYGVVQDDKVKEASENKDPDSCYICGEKLDDGGACPKCGTEPFEKKE